MVNTMKQRPIFGRGIVLFSLLVWNAAEVGFGFMLSIVFPMEGYNFVESIRQIICEPTTLQIVGWILSPIVVALGVEFMYQTIIKD